jgi:hypothetical protein
MQFLLGSFADFGLSRGRTRLFKKQGRAVIKLHSTEDAHMVKLLKDKTFLGISEISVENVD